MKFNLDLSWSLTLLYRRYSFSSSHWCWQQTVWWNQSVSLFSDKNVTNTSLGLALVLTGCCPGPWHLYFLGPRLGLVTAVSRHPSQQREGIMVREVELSVIGIVSYLVPWCQLRSRKEDCCWMLSAPGLRWVSCPGSRGQCLLSMNSTRSMSPDIFTL